MHEAESSGLRAAPSTGVQCSNGISGPEGDPRIHKQERGHRLRGFRKSTRRQSRAMRYAGIDIGSEEHAVTVVDADARVVVKPQKFKEDAEGYEKLRAVLGEASGEVMVIMEATGHYWQNLFAAITAWGYRIALINPLRTRRFAEEELARTKTDAIDSLGIARFGAQKKPVETRLPDEATQELREMVRLRDRLVQDKADRLRQLHRLVDLGFPEFNRHIKTLDGELAQAVLRAFPTAAAFLQPSARGRLAKVEYGGRFKVGKDLAQVLVEAARSSVGKHHGRSYQLQVQYTCDDLKLLRQRIKDIEGDISRTLSKHELGKLLTTIKGIGPQTSARILGEVGDPSAFESADTLAAYIGVVPGIKQSGKKRPLRGGLAPYGHARLRKGLWMPTIVATRFNPWLKAHYQRLRARGKPAKVAFVACMRKLVAAIYSVAKNRRAFVPVLPVLQEAVG